VIIGQAQARFVIVDQLASISIKNRQNRGLIMIINATQIREGMILTLDGDLYRVTWTMHRTPGKGVACMQTKLKGLQNNKNLEKRFQSNERVEKADLDTRKMQYLYKDSSGHVFMDAESFDQVTLGADILDGAEIFLQDGKEYQVTVFQENPVGIDFPKMIELKVTEAPPEIKKATASASLRPVTLENGMTVNTPGFIKEGDIIKVNTETNEYLERV
jgi:elongation factor P